MAEKTTGDNSPHTSEILDALARVTCCPYGQCQEGRVHIHGGCRAAFYRVSAKTKLDGLLRMGYVLTKKTTVDTSSPVDIELPNVDTLTEITNDRDHEQALRRISELWDADLSDQSAERELLRLANLVSNYEDRRWPIISPSSIDIPMISADGVKE